MAKRKRISDDAIGALFESQDEVDEVESQPPVAESTSRRSSPKSLPSPKKKERFTVHLSTELIERARNAVFWTPGLTLAALTEKALEATLDRLEEEQGEPFSARTAELKGGRPIKRE